MRQGEGDLSAILRAGKATPQPAAARPLPDSPLRPQGHPAAGAGSVTCCVMCFAVVLVVFGVLLVAILRFAVASVGSGVRGFRRIRGSACILRVCFWSLEPAGGLS